MINTNVIPVPVAGGDLEVHRFGDGPSTVVALHGITANGLCFAGLATELAGAARILAPDLRGRAGSRDVQGQYGLSAHVDDLIAILDHQAIDRTVVLGHSMGAYVVALAAARHPDRVAGAVLVDGGIAFPPPAGSDIDAVLTSAIGPAMTRLAHTFDDEPSYLRFLRGNPALAALLDGPAADVVIGYLRHDLLASGAGLRSSCRLEAVRADGADVLTDPETLGAAALSSVPARLLFAERGMLGAAPGLLTAAMIDRAGLPASTSTRFVADVDHFSILMSAPGVSAIAQATRELLASSV